jgi:putative membrane protein
MSSTSTFLRRLLIVGLALILVPFGMMLLITPMVGMWGGNHMWTGGMGPGTGLGWLWPLLWLAILVGVSYVLYTLLGGSEDQQTDPAIEELRAAYARGELSDEEFETRLERLRNDR